MKVFVLGFILVICMVKHSFEFTLFLIDLTLLLSYIGTVFFFIKGKENIIMQTEESTKVFGKMTRKMVNIKTK